MGSFQQIQVDQQGSNWVWKIFDLTILIDDDEDCLPKFVKITLVSIKSSFSKKSDIN